MCISFGNVDELLDDLLSDCQSPEDIFGESGLLKQLTKRLLERALAGELNHHLNREDGVRSSADEPMPRNSRNGHSAKTVQSEHGELELAIPRDSPKERLRQRQGIFEPVLVPQLTTAQ